jgi:geranylgeranyl diphosphate synthase type II
MKPLEEYQALIQEALADFKSANDGELYQPVNYILSLGGKRLRPALTLMACDVFEGDLKDAVSAALSMEVFHNFTLMHDDIMDKAPIRRGQSTVHVKWNTNSAILSGDAMLVQAYQLMAKAPAEKLATVLELFNTTALEVCEGQQSDMDFEERNDVTIDEYIEMIRLKTAVLLGCCLKTGAIIGGANEIEAQAIYDFGMNIGVAFQLQDDILDVYAEKAKFGKQVGGDILSNKKTFLLLKAQELAEAEHASDLHSWMSNADFDATEKVAAVTTIYDTLGVQQLARQEMQAYYEKALQKMDAIEVNDSRKQPLLQLAESLMVREF